jgi:hypothetical protein
MWSPTPIQMNTESSARFNFTDAFSGGALNADVLYDLSVLDSDGTQIFEKKGLTAMNSQDTQSIRFPAAGTYQLVLTITGLQSQPDQESETPPPVDRTRNGIARGTVVVSGQTNESAASPVAAPPSPERSTDNLTEQQPQQNQTTTTTAPTAPTAPPTPEQSTDNLTEQQPQPQPQQNQTEAESPAPSQNPFEQLGQAITNIFGG